MSYFDKSLQSQPWSFIKIKPTQTTFVSPWIYYNLQLSQLFGEKLKNHHKNLKKNLCKNRCSKQPPKVIQKNNFSKKQKAATDYQKF